MPESLRRFWLRTWAIARKELTHIRRDPRFLWMAIGMPVMLLVLFGFGVSFDINRVPVGLLDLDQTPTSQEVARSFYASGELMRVGEARDIAAAEAMLRAGTASGVLVLPRGLSTRLARGEVVDLQLLLDGSDANSTNQTLPKAEGVVRAIAAQQAGGAGMGPPGGLEVRMMTRFNPSGSSSLFLVPGLIAYVLAMVAVLLTALSVAREWERGSMEQLFATPVGRLDVIVGKLLPYLGLGYLQTALVLAAGAWIFGLPLRGLGLVLLASGLFLLGMLGQGLLISVVTKNQMLATQAGTFSSMLPSMLLSGFLFPVQNMPLVLQGLSVLVPARWFVALLRAVLLKGAGLEVVWPHLLGLTAFALLMIALSTARFQRRLA